MKDLKKILKKKEGKLMVIFPHPDDESFATGGLLLASKKMGWKTTILCLTKGGAGKIYVHGNGKSTKQIRKKELLNAQKRLRVDTLIVKDFDDGKLREQRSRWSKFLEETITSNNPDLIVTYDHTGITGHPDHIVLSLELLKIMKKKDNLHREFFWVSATKDFVKYFINPRLLKYFMYPTHKIKVGFWDNLQKYFAFSAHRSQNQMLLKHLLYVVKYNHEWYYRVDRNRKYRHKFIRYKI